MINNPLLDKDFLLELDKRKVKEKFARITSLTLDEHPIEQIEGRIAQGGSINIDGASAIRRSCSLNLIAENLDIHDFNWGLKTKFTLEIGLRNDFNFNYPNIIWFPQGTYVISSFGISRSTSNFNISIQGKDKMCLVNGEMGGTITSLTMDFGKYYDESSGEKHDYLIKEIIKSALHEWCFEPLHNIIINDLDESGVELLEYRGDKTLYLIRLVDENINPNKDFTNMTINGESKNWIFNNKYYSLDELKSEINFKFDNLTNFSNDASLVEYNGKFYNIAQINYGEGPIGYRETDLVYAGDLILNLGESVSTMLDKLVKMLGDFEYFYDLQGRFIFQKKRIYESKSWNSIINSDDDVYVENAELISPIAYSFDNKLLIQSINNNPQLNNVKNDFSVWGMRKTATGKEMPIHMRYAIDNKPISYTTYNGEKTYTNDIVDWREIIYQMAIDYRKNHDEDDFESKLAENNLDFYPTGKTGYEQYYTDMEGFWRQIYYYYDNDADAESLSYRPVTWSANDNHYVRPFLVNTNSNTKIKDIYIIENGKVYSYLDKINFKENNYYVKESDKYIEIIDTLDISQKNLYYQEDISYIPLWDTITNEEQRKIHIKIGSTYFPVWDYFNVWTQTGTENVTFFIKDSFTDSYREISLYYYKDNQKVNINTVNDLQENVVENLFYLNGENEVELKDINNIYIYKLRDLDNQILYIPYKEDGKDEVMKKYTETLSNDFKKKLFYKQEKQYYSIYNLLSMAKDSIYIKKNESYILLSDTTSHEGYILSPSIDEQKYVNDKNNYYVQIKSLEAPIKQLYQSKEINYIKTNYLAEDIDTSLQKVDTIFYESYTNFYNKNDKYAYWNKEYIDNPQALPFWIDFLDNDSELSQFSVKVIGNRTKTDNDSTVKAIYFKEIPTILLVNPESFNSLSERKTGYTYIQMPSSMDGLFNISSQGKSAQEAVAQMIYNYAYRQESINISAIPIYYLEPNTKIYVKDEDSKIDGYYIINKISLPLSYNGMMSITANRAIEKLY